MVNSTTRVTLSPTAACVLWLCAQPPYSPESLLWPLYWLFIPSFTQPPTPRLVLLLPVPPPCPSIPLDFVALALVHFLLALPFEGSTAFILAPSLASHHLSSWLPPSPSTPIGLALQSRLRGRSNTSSGVSF